MKLLKSADCWDWNSNCPACLSLLISSWAWTRTDSASHCAPEVSSTPYAAVAVLKCFFDRWKMAFQGVPSILYGDLPWWKRSHILKRWFPWVTEIFITCMKYFSLPLFFFQYFLRPPSGMFNHKCPFFLMEGHGVIMISAPIVPPPQIIFLQYLIFLIFLHLLKCFPLCKCNIKYSMPFFYHLRIILSCNTSHQYN